MLGITQTAESGRTSTLFQLPALENDPVGVSVGAAAASRHLAALLGEPCLPGPASLEAIWDGDPRRLPFSCSPLV